MAVRTNLLTNPSFEVDAAGWTPAPTRGTNGGGYSGTTHASGILNSLSDKKPATAGLPYTASGWFLRDTLSSREAAVTVHFYDSANVELSPPTVTLTSVTTQNVWQRFSQTRTAPAGTTQVALKYTQSTTNAALHADAFLLEQSSTLGDYFDGSTVKSGYIYAWTGTAHASSSTETPGRTNLHTNPASDGGTNDWVTTNSTVTFSADYAHSGTQSLKVIKNGSDGALQLGYGGSPSTGVPNAQAIPVVAGQTYTNSFWVRTQSSGVSGTGVKARADIFWQTASAFISASSGTQATLTVGAWTRVSVTATAPANAVKATSAVYLNSVVANAADTYVDDVLFEHSATLGDYFDGSTATGGYTYAWTGTAHASTSTEAYNGYAHIKSTVSTVPLNTATSIPMVVSSAVTSGDIFILAQADTGSGLSITAVSGLGATWSAVTNGTTAVTEFWVGTGATSSGTVTVTANNNQAERIFALYHIGGTTAPVTAVQASGSATQTTPVLQANRNQVVIGLGYGTTVFSGYTPASGWAEPFKATTTVIKGITSRVPNSASAETHTLSVTRSSGTAYVAALVVGDGNAPAVGNNIASAYSGTGTLSTQWTNYRNIDSNFSGEGTLSTEGIEYRINSAFSGEGTLSTTMARTIASAFSGEGTLSTTLTEPNTSITSDYSGEGTLSTDISNTPNVIASDFSAEGVLTTELDYYIQPAPLDALPLGKLVRYTVNNSAVPLNPAEGSGSAPSVNATYIKGRHPEFALGENFTVDNAAVGKYTGEIVRLSLGKKSDVASISTETLLSRTNVEMHLYPFIDAAPSTWTAARAIDYWTQQCGVFYDKIDGEVALYASGFGHANAYATGIGDSHFYAKTTAGTVSTVLVGDRSVTSFGNTATTVTSRHEATDETRVPVTVGTDKRLVFTLGVGIRGTGRTASTIYRFVDGADQSHEVRLDVTSDGQVTAKMGGSTVTALKAAGTGNYRVSFSIQRMSDTSVAGKLTIHSDNLDGTGVLLKNGATSVFTYSLPGTLWLTSLDRTSALGSGAEMLHWGTALTVSAFHPMEVPALQKTLGQSAKPLGFVSGFAGNVWKLLNEFCAVRRMDLSYIGDKLVVGPRTNGFSGAAKFGDFTVDAERREKYKQVAVVNQRSKAVTTGDAVLWRSDSVFQVAAREVFETTVQTEHSILSLSQPVAVNGILPFPYKQGTGQYVVTGADGYIISPAWWNENGGKVEVSMTENEGEIAIKITAPRIDTVRAPYRISEGEADRPALYISGSGIINDPVELHIASGARKAREGFDNVFESPFIATVEDAYNTAVRMAHQYSAAVAEVSFTTPNGFDVPSKLGTYPAGVVFTDNERNFKITDASQTHSETSGSAIPFTTIAAYNASFPVGSTIRDEKARHAGRTIKHANIKPLRSNDESA